MQREDEDVYGRIRQKNTGEKKRDDAGVEKRIALKIVEITFRKKTSKQRAEKQV